MGEDRPHLRRHGTTPAIDEHAGHEVAHARALIVSIGRLDQAALHAVRYSAVIPARERVAIHVALDGERAQHLGRTWMELELGRELKLQIIDPVGSVADTLAAAACDRLNAGAAQVVVLAARAHRSRAWGRGRTAEEIARELSRVRGALPVLLDTAPPPRTSR